MSGKTDKEIRQLVAKGMVQATNIERARCLWLCDELQDKLRFDLSKKVLIESERHLVETKMAIAGSIIRTLRMGIVMNKQIPEKKDNGEETEAE